MELHVGIQLPSALQFLSCDLRAESTDFLSTMLSVKLTRINLPLRIKQNVPEAWKNTFPGHQKQRWPESLVCCPVEGQVTEGSSQPVLARQHIPGTRITPPKLMADITS
jgi:hypothetical protein